MNSEPDQQLQNYDKKEDNFSSNRLRLAIISIVVGPTAPIEKLNELLHQYSRYIVGRMGLPQKDRGLNLISVALDAPNDYINALSGKIGRLPDIKVKVLYA
ncbi:MAG: TM1266 family iron-only hydrogenase system putative regulator [Candidatus Bruticola sp.]